MATYNITSPTGEKFRITAPDDATQEQIIAYAQKNAPAPKAKQQNPQPTVSNMGSFGLGMADMASFGLDDEIRAVGRSIGKGIPYDQALTEMRGEHEAGRQNPKSYIGGQVTGAIVPALATGGQSAVSIANPVARAAVSGGVQGGLYGAGSSEGEIPDRLVGAAKIGSIGALGGAGLSYAMSLLGRGVAQSASKLAGTVDDLKGTSPQIDEGTRKVIDKLRADFPDDAEYAKAVAQLGNKTIAEIAPQGGQVQRLARGAAQYPSGEKAITETLGDRAAGTTQRIKESVKDYISPNTDYYGAIDRITSRGQAKAKPLYEKAYQETVDLGDDIAPEIQQAIQKARTQYPSELKDLPDNSIKVLDYAKRVLDDDIGVAKRAGEGNFARSRTGIKNALLEKIDAASPNYAKARAVSGDYLSNTEALESGRAFMKLDADTIGKTYKAFNAGQKESFKAGISRSIRDIIDNSNDGTDIAKRILGKEEVRNKLKAVMSPKEYDELANTIRAEEKIFKLQKFVLGNSTTTSKVMDAADISSEAQDIIQTLATQGPRAATAQQLAKVITRTFSGLNDRTAGQVAKILMENDPQKKLALLNNVKSLPKGESQLALEAFFHTNNAVNKVRKYLPKPDAIGTGAGAIAGAATPLEVTVRPTEEMKRRNLTTKNP